MNSTTLTGYAAGTVDPDGDFETANPREAWSSAFAHTTLESLHASETPAAIREAWPEHKPRRLHGSGEMRLLKITITVEEIEAL